MERERVSNWLRQPCLDSRDTLTPCRSRGGHRLLFMGNRVRHRQHSWHGARPKGQHHVFAHMSYLGGPCPKFARESIISLRGVNDPSFEVFWSCRTCRASSCALWGSRDSTAGILSCMCAPRPRSNSRRCCHSRHTGGGALAWYATTWLGRSVEYIFGYGDHSAGVRSFPQTPASACCCGHVQVYDN